MKLQHIHEQFDTDKGTAHSYIHIYDHLFEPVQHEPINFLEIGALTCGSLKMFHTYFSQAQIYGVDNWSQQADHKGQSFLTKGVDMVQIIQDVTRNYPRCDLITCDSTNVNQVQEKFHQLRMDVIVDDGDHHPHAQIVTFKNFLPFWNQMQGTYVIEDVQDVSFVCAHIQEHVHMLGLHLRVTPYVLLKNNRSDDNLIVIHT